MRAQQHPGKPPVAACQHRLEPTEVTFVVAVVDAARRQTALQQMHAPQIFIRADLLLPLKRRKGLRHKKRRGKID